MRVGVYIDAFNLYYGMRGICGRGTSGWRWLDVRAVAESLCGWQGSTVHRVVYCTARVDPKDNPDAHRDQSVYLNAIQANGSIDVLELGRYVAWPKSAPLARANKSGKAELIIANGKQQWSTDLPIRPATNPNGDDVLMATVRMREEKGSDVNVATHLLTDVFCGQVDGAIVISNDSDLALPVHTARQHVPVGTVNPSSRQLAGALRGTATEGAGRHWWARLSAQHYYSSQLADPVDNHWRKPTGW
ncbi:NYN domain-containing protein [Nocardia salmonicida]|uniref:NYN domain-containing protein n=1 Tax=Nocardia TaxID=1817 RepID=UPI00265AB6E7|nr:NYN domain-containing protein [Nocardia sp. PE-7]WKG10192.1 NYN domain-containing protein [Nocardia sp. PE-7]